MRGLSPQNLPLVSQDVDILKSSEAMREKMRSTRFYTCWLVEIFLDSFYSKYCLRSIVKDLMLNIQMLKIFQH